MTLSIGGKTLPRPIKRVRKTNYSEDPIGDLLSSMGKLNFKKDKAMNNVSTMDMQDFTIDPQTVAGGSKTPEVTNTYYEQMGAEFSIKNRMNSTIHDYLPGGNYSIKFHPMRGFWLEKISDFEYPKKIYGKTIPMADRILNSFRAKSTNMGVVLEGEKGSGKTMLGRVVSKKAADDFGIPTLFITSPMVGESFYQFLYTIRQECIIFIDEYEKVYSRDQQESMLTLLDGVFQSKKLFILTCNDRNKLDIHLKNRPGRVHYMLEFKGLDREFVKEYCTDSLEDKSKVEEVVNITSLFSTMNFDMLQAIVWEMNLYKEPAAKTIQLLNAKPENDDYTEYTITARVPGIDQDILVNPRVLRGSPLKSQDNFTEVRMHVYMLGKDNWAKVKELFPTLCNDSNEGFYEYIEEDSKVVEDGYLNIQTTFGLSNLNKLDWENSSFEFKHMEGEVPILITCNKLVRKQATYEGLYNRVFTPGIAGGEF